MAWIGVTIIVIVAIIYFDKSNPTTNTNAVTNTDTTRATYAAEYDGLWRQDDGQNPVLITATAFPPYLQAALHKAANRTSVEDQIWSTVSTMPGTSLPIFLTFDSVSGNLTDAEISASLEVQVDNGTKMHLEHWTPLVGNTHIVNAASGTSSQIGVAVFSANNAINWNHPPQFHLLVKKIAGEAERSFIWTSAALQAPTNN